MASTRYMAEQLVRSAPGNPAVQRLILTTHTGSHGDVCELVRIATAADQLIPELVDLTRAHRDKSVRAAYFSRADVPADHVLAAAGEKTVMVRHELLRHLGKVEDDVAVRIARPVSDTLVPRLLAEAGEGRVPAPVVIDLLRHVALRPKSVAGDSHVPIQDLRTHPRYRHAIAFSDVSWEHRVAAFGVLDADQATTFLDDQLPLLTEQASLAGHTHSFRLSVNRALDRLAEAAGDDRALAEAVHRYLSAHPDVSGKRAHVWSPWAEHHPDLHRPSPLGQLTSASELLDHWRAHGRPQDVADYLSHPVCDLATAEEIGIDQGALDALLGKALLPAWMTGTPQMAARTATAWRGLNTSSPILRHLGSVEGGPSVADQLRWLAQASAAGETANARRDRSLWVEILRHPEVPDDVVAMARWDHLAWVAGASSLADQVATVAAEALLAVHEAGLTDTVESMIDDDTPLGLLQAVLTV